MKHELSGFVGRYSSNGLRRLISSLNSIRFRDDVGEVEYFGQKVVLLRRDAFSLIRKELSRVAGTASGVILEVAGHRVGSEEGIVLSSKAEGLGLNNPEALPEFIRTAVEESNMGFGKMQVKELEIPTGKAVVVVQNSFEAEDAGVSLRPICRFTSGYLEGIFGQLTGKNMRAKEIECRAKGDTDCKFILALSTS